MKVKFKNGTITKCSTPTEQKIFKLGEAAGWILTFTLLGDITSGDVDELITGDNISELTFISENEEGVETSFTLSDYERISSAIIRYADEQEKTRVEIHLTKGV
jgi:ACT domain-containing protein